MTSHKLLLDDFYDASYVLIAVHTLLEDYRLAYFLNQFLGLKLTKSKNDIDVNSDKESYPIYEWKDYNKFNTWYLVANKFEKKELQKEINTINIGFQHNFITTTYLVPEFKKVDYFIKICYESTFIDSKNIINNVNSIPQIITAYGVDLNQLKSKKQLIF